MKQKEEKASKANLKPILKRAAAAIAVFVLLYIIYVFVSDWETIAESFNKGWNSYN